MGDFLVSLPEIFMKCQMSKLLIEFFFYLLHLQCIFFIFFTLAMQVFNIFCVGIASFFLFFGFWSRDLFTNLRIYDLQIYNVLNEMDICRKIETLYTPELGYAIFHRGHLDQFDGTNLCKH